MLIVGVGCRGDALVWNFPTRGVRRSGRSAARQVVHYGAGSGKVLGRERSRHNAAAPREKRAAEAVG